MSSKSLDWEEGLMFQGSFALCCWQKQKQIVSGGILNKSVCRLSNHFTIKGCYAHWKARSSEII
jgi:hypothetical protein